MIELIGANTLEFDRSNLVKYVTENHSNSTAAERFMIILEEKKCK